jgi:nucleotide-binding universal stress UspA family protein
MNVLVCTDGSPASRSILPHAGRFARAAGAELVLTRVFDPLVDAISAFALTRNEAVAKVEAEWRRELEAEVAGTGLPGGVHIAHRDRRKDIADAIHEAADETGAAMIAVASRGAGAVRHAVFGSVAMDVIARTDIPVMTLAGTPAPADRTGLYHIVVTCDGSADSLSVFRGLGPLLTPGKFRVTLLQVATADAGHPEAEVRSQTLAYLESLRGRLPAGVACEVHVPVVPVGGGVDTAISVAAVSVGADAIASATHGHSARRHLFMGSTALGVVQRAVLPVILVKSSAVD